MKTITQTLTLIIIVTGLVMLTNASLKAQTIEQTDTINPTKMKKSDNKKTIKLEVKGMSCQKGCADGLDAKFKKVNGILKSKTTFDESTSEITFDDSIITEREIIAIIERRGFKAKVLVDKENKSGK